MKIIIFTAFFLIPLSANTASAKIYKCTAEQGVIFQSDPCPVTDSIKSNSNTFGFDDWVFGTSIPRMKQISQRRNLAITPGTLQRVQEGYNQTVINRKPLARSYNYWTKVMGKDAKVLLNFTKSTRELYQINVKIMAPQSSQEERRFFFESLYDLLTEKYGRPVTTSRDDVKKARSKNSFGAEMMESLLGRLLVWGGGTVNTVTLPYKKNYHQMRTYNLNYSFAPLVKQNEKEVTYELRTRTKAAAAMDSSKL